jgi:hypothetical protein
MASQAGSFSAALFSVSSRPRKSGSGERRFATSKPKLWTEALPSGGIDREGLPHVAGPRPGISWLRHTRATVHYAHDSLEHPYSPMIPKECLRLLTSTRFRRRPSNSRVSHPAVTRSAPTYQRLRRAQPGRRAGRWSPQPPRLRLAPHAASGARRPSLLSASPCPAVPTGVLAGAVVQPTFWSAAHRPASSLMKTRDVISRALSRVSPLFIIYRSHTTDCRGPGGDRPRPE